MAPARTTPARKIAPRLLFAVGALAFFAAAIAMAPASLIAPALSRPGVAIAYERIDGRLWRGTISALTIDGAYLGDLDYALAPLALLRGEGAARLRIEGPTLQAAGDVSIALSGERARVSNLRGRMDLRLLERFSYVGLLFTGEADIALSRLAWSRTAGCEIGEGEIAAELRDATGRSVFDEPLRLEGALTCEGERLATRLAGRSLEGLADIDFSVGPDFDYALTASLTPTRDDLRRNLELIGFENKGTALVYDAVGALKGPGS